MYFFLYVSCICSFFHRRYSFSFALQLAILKMWLLQFICVNVVKSNNLLWMHAISLVTYILYTPSVICTMSIEAFSELNQLPFQLKAMAKKPICTWMKLLLSALQSIRFSRTYGQKTPPIQMKHWKICQWQERKKNAISLKQNEREKNAESKLKINFNVKNLFIQLTFR